MIRFHSGLPVNGSVSGAPVGDGDGEPEASAPVAPHARPARRSAACAGSGATGCLKFAYTDTNTSHRLARVDDPRNPGAATFTRTVAVRELAPVEPRWGPLSIAPVVAFEAGALHGEGAEIAPAAWLPAKTMRSSSSVCAAAPAAGAPRAVSLSMAGFGREPEPEGLRTVKLCLLGFGSVARALCELLAAQERGLGR